MFLGPAVFLACLVFADLKPGDPVVTRMAAVALLMAVWWITEAIPLAATALLPLVLFPLLGIMKGKETAPVYVNSVIFLFIGGFLIALAMEKWMLHKRIALTIIRVVGGGPSRLVLSFMIASAFLSMWISNTATAIMMLAIGLAIIAQSEATFGVERSRRLTVGLLLGIAYGSSIGGMATLVGTPPNLSLVRIFEITFPEAEPIGFGQWMLMALPLSGAMLVIAWFLITRVFYRAPADLRIDRAGIDEERKKLGPMCYEEKAVLVVFLATALLWVFRKDLQVGGFSLPGWSRALPHSGLIDDGTIAIAMALSLFLIPARRHGDNRSTILGMGVFSRVPWHIVLLFGGGFALAKGFQVTGLSAFIGEKFSGMEGTDPLPTIAVVSGTLTFLTELTSNTATTEMILPVLASVAQAMKLDPLLLMIPATLSASCAFMMPVATPPNAIVFGSGRITVAEMAKIGLVINLVGVVLITFLFYFVGTAVLAIDPSVFPEWAQGAQGQ